MTDHTAEIIGFFGALAFIAYILWDDYLKR